MTSERSLSANEAQQLWLAELSALNLTYQTQRVGTQEPFTYLCDLIDKETGKKLARGVGKGVGMQAQMSAYFESLEHYLTTLLATNKPYQFYSLAEVKQQKIATLMTEAEKLFCDENLQGKKCPWITFDSEITGRTIHLPIMLVDPDYASSPHPEDELDYDNLFVCSTNNGSAIGCTKAEAMVHALSELIERDALSLFLLKTFVKANPDKPKIINHQTLPADLFAVIKNIEAQAQDKLIIYDLESSFGIPAYGAMFAASNHERQFRGYGASLSESYAIERAALEALQSYHMQMAFPDAEPNLFATALVEWPKHLTAAIADIGQLIRDDHYQLINFGCYAEINLMHNDVEGYLVKLIEKINSHGFDILTSIFHASSNGITALKVLVPDLEDFYMVEQGYPALPGERGKAVLHHI